MTTVATSAGRLSGRAALHRHRILKWLAAIVAVAVIVWFLPLFHIVPLQAARDQAALAGFDAAAFVDPYWDGPLRESVQGAPDAAGLLAALRRDFTGTADRFGHRLGLGGKVSFFVSGQGHVVEVQGRIVGIALEENGPAEIAIRTGPVFGNAIRDGSGLFDVSEFASVQDFNAISVEINRRIETEVLPNLEAIAEVGAPIRFIGGIEIADSGDAPDTLNVVPVRIEAP